MNVDAFITELFITGLGTEAEDLLFPKDLSGGFTLASFGRAYAVWSGTVVENDLALKEHWTEYANFTHRSWHDNFLEIVYHFDVREIRTLYNF
jgi:hypothetical protein